MKRTLLFAACTAVLFSISTSAGAVVKKRRPSLTLGAKVGANMQHMSGSTTSTWDNTYKAGILGGVFMSVNKRKTGIRVEGLIKTAQFDIYNTNLKVKTVNLDIPVLFEVKVVKRTWLQIGPQFSSIISAKRSDGPDVKGNFRTSDLSLAGGVEITLPARLTVGLRYVKGLVNVNNLPAAHINGSEKWKNTSIQFSVGFRFID